MKQHPLYIPFDRYQSPGGPATFMGNLREFFEKRNFSCQTEYSHAKVIFFPVTFSLTALNSVKQKGGYVIQRLDGIYYPSKHGEQYIAQNETIQTIYAQYADCVVFQSEYSQAQCFVMFGKRAHTHIIYNGVQKQIFYPHTTSREDHISSQIRFITTGNFRNGDMLEPIVQALDGLQGTFDFTLTVVGPVTAPALTPYLSRNYIRHVGSKSLEEIADLLRHSHIFLYSHLNPPCPNSVIEAISCGLPVVGFQSGAMAELCYFSQELLVPVSRDIFQQYEDFNPQKLAEKIVLAVEQYAQYREVALAHCHLYDFEECGQRYLEIFEQYLTQRRKIVPVLTYPAKHLMHTLRNFPQRVKSSLMHRLFLSENSYLERLALRIDQQHVITCIVRVLKKKSLLLSPQKALKMLFELENALYLLEGKASVRYGNGIHTKHRHIDYHDFFVRRIESGCRVLDVGCGNGALTYDIATHAPDVTVYGIDILERNITAARERYSANNIRFVCGDALHDLPEQHFDIVVLSNVLEHLEKRVDFLRALHRHYHPQKLLIRVPMYERDWRVPLKEELGIEYRLDTTHWIEYRQGEFREEIIRSGLRITDSQVSWGEIWAEVRAPEDLNGCKNTKQTR